MILLIQRLKRLCDRCADLADGKLCDLSVSLDYLVHKKTPPEDVIKLIWNPKASAPKSEQANFTTEEVVLSICSIDC